MRAITEPVSAAHKIARKQAPTEATVFLKLLSRRRRVAVLRTRAEDNTRRADARHYSARSPSNADSMRSNVGTFSAANAAR